MGLGEECQLGQQGGSEDGEGALGGALEELSTRLEFFFLFVFLHLILIMCAYSVPRFGVRYNKKDVGRCTFLLTPPSGSRIAFPQDKQRS